MTMTGGLVVLLLLASSPAQAAGMGWSAPVPLTGHVGAGGQAPLASTGPLSAVAAFDVPSAGTEIVQVRTTTDGGYGWGSPITVSTPGGGYAVAPSVAAHGLDVDVLFEQGDGCEPFGPGTTPCPLFVAHSGDGGTSFSLPVRVGSSVGGQSAVATDGSHVAVIWEEPNGGKVKVRVSTDHGLSFGPTKGLGAADDFAGTARVAVAKGIVNVIYDVLDAQYRGLIHLMVRRSTDLGAHWSHPRDIAEQANFAHILAVGQRVLATYITEGTKQAIVHLIRSTDGGATWTAPIRLSPASQPDVGDAWLAWNGNRFVTAFERCVTHGCHSTHTYVRTSQTGKNWTPVSDVGSGFPSGLAARTTIIVGRFDGTVASTQRFSVRVGARS